MTRFPRSDERVTQSAQQLMGTGTGTSVKEEILVRRSSGHDFSGNDPSLERDFKYCGFLFFSFPLICYLYGSLGFSLLRKYIYTSTLCILSLNPDIVYFIFHVEIFMIQGGLYSRSFQSGVFDRHTYVELSLYFSLS